LLFFKKSLRLTSVFFLAIVFNHNRPSTFSPRSTKVTKVSDKDD